MANRAYKYNLYKLVATTFVLVWRGNTAEKAVREYRKAYKTWKDLAIWELFNNRDRPTLAAEIQIPEEDVESYTNYGWSLLGWHPADYSIWRPAFHPDTGALLESVYMGIDFIIDLLKTHNVPIEYAISGSPNDDNDMAAQWESLRKRMARDDLLERHMWSSCSGCAQWESLVRANNRTPEMFLKEVMYKEFGPGIDNAIDGHVTMPDGLGYTWNRFPQKVVVALSRYGYDCYSVYGEASEEEKRLNRLGSAIVGMPAKDFDPKTEGPQTQSETIQMICAEWVRGMGGRI